MSLDPQHLDELREVEKRALGAHKRWKARRAMKVRGWVCFAVGVVVGAGFIAVLIAGMGYLP